MEQSGLKLTLEGLQQALKGLSDYTKALEKVGATTQKVESITSKSKGFDISKSLSETSSKLSAFNAVTGNSIPLIGQLQSHLGGLSGAFATLSPTVIAAGAALGVAAAAFVGFLALGKRGAALEPTLVAFSNIQGGAQQAGVALDQMRQDTRGTIADFELMRLSVQGLQGTTTEFRAVVGKDFGAILDVTQRVAQATGQSAEIIREKFILGLRRQSVKLLDDVGVVVQAEQAYQRYAEAQGLAAGSLTQTQKQAAFATEALRQLRNVGSEIGQPAQALELLRIPLVTITNLLDKLSLAVQPAFRPLVGIVAEVSSALQYLAAYVFPIVSAAATIIGTQLTAVWSAIKFIIQGVVGDLEGVGNTLAYIAAAASLFATAFQASMQQAAVLVQQFGTIISRVADIVGLNNQKMAGDVDNTLGSLAGKLARSGGRITGAFAAGLLSGGKYVIDAATKIAQIVADFLEGFSPPKTGPLSKIDIGGENVARAWAEGFSSGLMRPIEEIAGEVNDALGKAGLGNVTSEAIKKRLLGLDSAIQPFKDSLTIVKSTVEKIAGFVDPALKVVERQRKTLLDAFSKGKVEAEAVRALDRQVEMLNKLKESEQDRIDNAELQLKLAEAQQAEERALLSIAQSRLPVEQAVSEAAQAAREVAGGGGAGSAAKDADDAARGAAKKAGGGGGGAAEQLEEGAAAAFGGGTMDVLANSKIDAAKADILAFAGQIGGNFSQGLEDSGYNDALADFQGSTGELQAELARIKAADPVGKLKDKFATLGTIATAPLDALKGVVTTGIDAVQDAINSLDVSSIGSNINNALSAANLAIQTGFAFLQLTFTTAITALTAPFVEGGAFSSTGVIVTSLTSVFGEGGSLSTVLSNAKSAIDTFVGDISSAGFTLIVNLLTGFEDPFTHAETSIKETIVNIGSAVKTFVADLPTFLTGVQTTLQTNLINPFIDALNSIIAALESAINSVLTAGGLLGGVARDVFGIDNVNLGRIPSYASGGMAQRGLALVGERGAELVNFGRRAQVFPAGMTRDMLSAAPMPLPSSTSNNQTYNNQRNYSNTFNVGSPDQSILIMRQMEMGLR